MKYSQFSSLNFKTRRDTPFRAGNRFEEPPPFRVGEYVSEPPFKHESSGHIWENACESAETYYMKLIENGEPAQLARSVLPKCLKTEIVMTCNFREWLHVFTLRTSPAAHPQIKEIMDDAKKLLAQVSPTIFA